VNAPNS